MLVCVCAYVWRRVVVAAAAAAAAAAASADDDFVIRCMCAKWLIEGFLGPQLASARVSAQCKAAAQRIVHAA